MIDSSKYKITHKVQWSDNLGRWTAEYNSDLLGIQSTYLVPDQYVAQYSEEMTLTDSAQDILELNFWFVCLQVESARTKEASAEVPAIA